MGLRQTELKTLQRRKKKEEGDKRGLEKQKGESRQYDEDENETNVTFCRGLGQELGWKGGEEVPGNNP